MPKKLIIIVAILTFYFQLLTLNCCAQPNGGFENWTTEFSYENPDGRQTGNFFSLLNPPNPLSTFKATGIDTHSGFYALKLKTVYLNNNPWPGVIEDTSGAAFTGKVNPSPFSYKYGYSYTGRPEKLGFWCKYTPVGNDTANIVVSLQKFNGTTHDTIGGGAINILATAQYTFFQIDISYLSTALPDTASILILSSKNRLSARINSTLYVDDVLFTGWVGIDEKNSVADKVKIFPNPVKEALTISAKVEDAANVRIFDSFGKSVSQYKIQNNKVNIQYLFIRSRHLLL